jgi:hypothetical protein
VWAELEKLLAETGSPERSILRDPISGHIEPLVLGDPAHRGAGAVSDGAQSPLEGPLEEAQAGGPQEGADCVDGAWFLLTATRRRASDETECHAVDIAAERPASSPAGDCAVRSESGAATIQNARKEQDAAGKPAPSVEHGKAGDASVELRALCCSGSPPAADGATPGDVGHEPLGTACSPAGTAAKELWSAPAEASGETASFSNLSDTRTATTSGRAGSKKFLITDVTNTPAGNSVSPAGRAVSSGPDAPAAVLSQITPKGETPAGKRFAIRDVGQAEPVRREDSAGGVSSRPAAPLCGKRGLGGVFPEPAPRPSAGSRRASESDACVLGLEHRTTSPALSAKEWDERLLGADAGKMDKAELVDAVLAMQQRLKALTHETAELQRETDAIRAKIGTMQ